ncbi:hypothetical protein V6582_06140 [Agrobacterium vitis]|uniref:hypothetical protein n=1 Tax=Agrobacterium vitis TaxID=373 RepID=UPI0030E4CDB4
MRLMLFQMDGPAFWRARQGCVPAKAIFAAVGHIGIRLKVIPGGLKIGDILAAKMVLMNCIEKIVTFKKHKIEVMQLLADIDIGHIGRIAVL